MKKSNKRSQAAKKANARRQLERTLSKRYGYATAQVVLAAERGDNNRLDSLRVAYGWGSVAAVLANRTRGTYDWAF